MYTRAIPVALYELPPEQPERTHTLPYETWQAMTPAGQHICRHLVCDPGEVPAQVGSAWKPNWHNLGNKIGTDSSAPRSTTPSPPLPPKCEGDLQPRRP